jgi:hypothetical protein
MYRLRGWRRTGSKEVGLLHVAIAWLVPRASAEKIAGGGNPFKSGGAPAA